MIARGAEGNPWVFAQAKAALAGVPEPPAPDARERIAMARRHARLLARREGKNIVRMRKHAMWYLAGLPGAAAARAKINACVSVEDFDRVFDELLALVWAAMNRKASTMPHDPYRALYLHLPFCVRRCGYCDFATSAVPADAPEIDAYVEDLCLQIRRKAKEGELGALETVYLGGGTPSHIGLARLSMLLYTLSLSMHLTPEVECTMEANPESLTERMVRDAWALGVNRLSIGVQSFDDAVLAVLGRAHSADDARRAIEAAHTRFENVSVDLMCGIPGQGAETLRGERARGGGARRGARERVPADHRGAHALRRGSAAPATWRSPTTTWRPRTWRWPRACWTRRASSATRWRATPAPASSAATTWRTGRASRTWAWDVRPPP